jgi:hypothetical protein
MCTRSISPLQLLESPYSTLRPVEGGKAQLKAEGRRPGSALIWVLERGATESDRNIVEQRPGGRALIVILPRVADLANDPSILHLLEACPLTGSCRFTRDSPSVSLLKCSSGLPTISALRSPTIWPGAA